jgi:hypothetical protein
MRKLAKQLFPVVLTAAVMVLGTATVSRAGRPVPEVDPSTGMGAMALIAGAVLLIRGRLKK